MSVSIEQRIDGNTAQTRVGDRVGGPAAKHKYSPAPVLSTTTELELPTAEKGPDRRAGYLGRILDRPVQSHEAHVAKVRIC